MLVCVCVCARTRLYTSLTHGYIIIDVFACDLRCSLLSLTGSWRSPFRLIELDFDEARNGRFFFLCVFMDDDG